MRNRKQEGAALVLALGLVAMVAAWAATALSEDEISLRRAANMQLSTKAWLAAESGLELARLALEEDARTSNIDHLQEDWAKPSPPFPVDNGTVQGVIVDANRLFNLNDLVDAGGKAQAAAIAIAKRLFAQLALDPNLVDALVDWMDADDQPFGVGGAEDLAYVDRPYRVKNAPLDRMQELLLIRGFDQDAVMKLKQVAMARPSKGITPININTAPKEVLRSLGEGIPAADIEAIVAARKETPFAKVGDLTSQSAYTAWAGKINQAWLSVSSDAFTVLIEARFGRILWRERALMARRGGKVHMLYRERMPWTG